ILPPPPRATLFPYTTLFRSQGGVLPLGLRGGPFCTPRLEHRSRADPRRPPAPARRLALPPALEPPLSADPRARRHGRERARLRHPANRRATRLRALARASLRDRPRE